MNRDHLLDAFADISEDYIIEAAPENAAPFGKKNPAHRFVRWGVIAACVLLCVALTIPLYQHSFVPSDEEHAPLEVPKATTAEENEPTEMPAETNKSNLPPITGEGAEIDGETLKEPTEQEPPIDETTGVGAVIDDPMEEKPDTGFFDETTVAVTTAPPRVTTTATEIPNPPEGHAPWADLIINPAEKNDLIARPGNTISYYAGEGVSPLVPFDPAVFKARLGIDYDDFTEKIPAQFALQLFYSRDIVAGKPHDYVFEYRAEGGKHLGITLSAEGSPLWGYQFGNTDVPQISSVYGVSVTIYAYQDILIAQFVHGNVAYELAMAGGSLYEVWTMIAALVS